MKYFYLFLFCIISCIQADWIWSPDTGWMNSRYAPQESAQQQLARASQWKQEGNYEDAAEIYYQIHKSYPFTPEGQNSLFQAAECLALAEEYYQAHLYLEEYKTTYPRTEKLPEILQKQYEWGATLVTGKDDSINIMGFTVASSAADGVEVLKQVLQDAPFLDFVDDAQLMIANYYFKIEEYRQARLEYEKLLQEYEKSEWCSFAQFQIAHSHWKEFKSLEFDIEPLVQTKKSMKNILKNIQTIHKLCKLKSKFKLFLN